MSDQLFFQNVHGSPKVPGAGEQNPDAAGAEGAQRREPERSDGERSGAPSAPAASPPTTVVPTAGVAADRAEMPSPEELFGDQANSAGWSAMDAGDPSLGGIDPDALFADEAEALPPPFAEEDTTVHLPPLAGRGRRGRRLVKPEAAKPTTLTAEQRLLLLDTWQRSQLPAGDFAALVGVSKHTLYGWKAKYGGMSVLLCRERSCTRDAGSS